MQGMNYPALAPEERTYKSARRANQMANDLLDLARCNLGEGIPVFPEVTNLSTACQSVISELQIAHPGAFVIYSLGDSITGHFDPSRIDQVFSNLIGNAIRHGAKEQPIHVALSSDGEFVFFEVQNQGEAIPAEALPDLSTRQVVIRVMPQAKKGLPLAWGWGFTLLRRSLKGTEERLR